MLIVKYYDVITFAKICTMTFLNAVFKIFNDNSKINKGWCD